MGATDFVTFVPGTNTMKAAYQAAVSQALSEYGHDGYNGTISTTSGARQVVHTPVTSRTAAFYAQAHIDDAQKWEDALAVPVADDSQFKFSTAKFKVTLDPTKINTEWDIKEAATEMAFAKYGHTLDRVDVTVKMTTKTVVESAKGSAVTRYELVRGYNSQMFVTKAEAVAAAKKMLESGHNADTQVSIRAVKFYPESGTVAAKVKRVTTKATADVVVTIATPKVNNPGLLMTTGWLFFGLAAC